MYFHLATNKCLNEHSVQFVKRRVKMCVWLHLSTPINNLRLPMNAPWSLGNLIGICHLHYLGHLKYFEQAI